MMTDTTIPKQERLIKLLRMTTSPNDGEALTALRMATKLLDDAGWTWDKLINGKIVVVADPFANIPMPQRVEQPAPTPRYAPNPTPPRVLKNPQGNLNIPLSTVINQYPGFCYCCGNEVPANAGKRIKPNEYSLNTINQWRVLCIPCNTSGFVTSHAAARKKTRARSISDLA